VVVNSASVFETTDIASITDYIPYGRGRQRASRLRERINIFVPRYLKRFASPTQPAEACMLVALSNASQDHLAHDSARGVFVTCPDSGARFDHHRTGLSV